MTYGRQKSHRWPVGAGLSLGAVVAAVAAFLAPSITAASAEGATATPADTAAAATYSCSASVDGTALGRNAWTGSTNAHPAKADAAANAFDGNDRTRFSTGEYQAAGLYFRVRPRLQEDLQPSLDERARFAYRLCACLRS